MKTNRYVIGIDVGGTNTDSVIINPSNLKDEKNRGIVAFEKTPTTSDVTSGIKKSLEGLFEKLTASNPEIRSDEICSVTIGTTHFINAVVERDPMKLDRIAVIRLVGPCSRELPPFSDFPRDLASLINGYTCYCDGGYRINRKEISHINKSEIISNCEKIREIGLNTIAVIGMFSPVAKDQEIAVRKIIKDTFTDWNVDIVLSQEIGGIGFLERENITIINAAIKRFAISVIHSFQQAVREFGLDCQILLTQNDGTALTVKDAIRTPIKTFSSGTTNSMRGASFLCRKELQAFTENKPVLVLDIGGTTTDAGLLETNGFPRHYSTHTLVGGVRTILSKPDVRSIGLGAGSIVRIEEDVNNRTLMSIGPDSVASSLETKALVFGGKIATTTDIALLSRSDKEIRSSKNPIFQNVHLGNVKRNFSEALTKKYNDQIKIMIDQLVDTIKTNADPIPAILVGGGSYIVPSNETLNSCESLIRPENASIANAIGAALTEISADETRFVETISEAERGRKLKEVEGDAIKKIIEMGVDADSIRIMNVINDAVPYTSRVYHLCVKVIGRPDYSKILPVKESLEFQINEYARHADSFSVSSMKEIKSNPDYVNIHNYAPEITNQREWILSELDLEFMRVGTYILGCGGGGDPYSKALQSKAMIRGGSKMVVIDVDDAFKFSGNSSRTVALAACGSPSVIAERLQGYEFANSLDLLQTHNKSTLTSVMPMEIGGSNGFQGFLLGGLPEHNLKILDADMMGRAYPMIWQISPVISKDMDHNKSFFEPCAFSDGAGTDILLSKVSNDHYAETLIRTSLTELGSYVGLVTRPMDFQFLKKHVIRNSISLSWRIGRAVYLAKENLELSRIPDFIVDAVGGPNFGKVLMKGKIIAISRKLQGGLDYGEVEIESEEKTNKGCVLTIRFMNENLLCKWKITNKIVATVPDLITVIDQNSGEAIGTPDYRYGLSCSVLIVRPNAKWIETEYALKIGGPAAFGMETTYKPFFKELSHRSNGLSVISEFAT